MFAWVRTMSLRSGWMGRRCSWRCGTLREYGLGGEEVERAGRGVGAEGASGTAGGDSRDTLGAIGRRWEEPVRAGQLSAARYSGTVSEDPLSS